QGHGKRLDARASGRFRLCPSQQTLFRADCVVFFRVTTTTDPPSHPISPRTNVNSFGERVEVPPADASRLRRRVWNGLCRRRRARQKGPEDDISAQRPEIGDHYVREMAAKTAFLLASGQLRVSEDCVVADAV